MSALEQDDWPTMFKVLTAIGLGASFGAILRWFLGRVFNAVFPAIPLGTLLANYLGAYLIGLAIAVFALLPTISPEWRLFIITGFLGGLTTFSTFSAEILALLQAGRLWLAAAAIALHVGGSLILTFLGLLTVTLLRRL